MVEATSEQPTNHNSPKAGTPEAAIVVEKWWKRFGPTKGGLNIFDREENDQLDALEAVPAELEDYYDGIYRRHLAEVQDLMVNNGINFVEKSGFAEKDAVARSIIEMRGYTDQLTGLKNRRWLEEKLEETVKDVRNNPESNVWVLFADIDKFKTINTLFDHTGGDKLLSIMGKLARRNEQVARFGGEEFVQIIDLNDVRIDDVPDAADEDKIKSIIDRYSTAYKDNSSEMLKTMEPKSTLREDEIPEGGIPKVVTLSFGATKILPGETSLQVLSRASTAVAEAKNAGRDTAYIAVPSESEFSFQRLAAVA